ncbi:MAG TPA: undecaprenyl-diphosphate phosphatase [Gemmataceae bacterium]|nr:undecaprenyl-diphosphate phosphatase [Gemmataceae bacterium]
MSYLEILILAVIQGLAELLPISSSAHVILTAKLMGLKPSSPEFVFLLVMLHTGTMFAVIVYFWPRWKWLIMPSSNAESAARGPLTRKHFLKMIVLATACTGVLGFGLKTFIESVVLKGMLHRDKGEIEELFDSLPLMAASLLSVGIFIILAGRRENKIADTSVTLRSASWIGMVQGLCLPFRGFSRSGATISTALWLGMERMLAEEFSFALAVVLTPVAIGWSIYKLVVRTEWTSETHLIDLVIPGLVGMIFSFIAGLLALKILSAVLEKGRWQVFGYYCVCAALVVLGFAIAGY